MKFSKGDLAVLIKLLAGSIVLAVLYPLIMGLAFNRQNFSDGLSIAGILLMVAGLFRLVNCLGQFDSTRYGYKKLIEVIRTKNYVRSQSKLPSLAEYKKQHPYKKRYLPLLAAAVIDIVAALLMI